ncbi:hypothetical protein [Paenibacillus graminis]|uniref:Uncharacterized protein n=1 Tax=Paenibacillus graminis TaxID=189425 RepID=A0A089M6X5_9BACL|nr:hypothetical protein [Paenibacillus graminis]AIQ69551.1 hypothetical protein PGRAT_19370 [Paenibacillus graminis]
MPRKDGSVNLYYVVNGYMGNGPHFVTVIAKNEAAAKTAASEMFKKHAFSSYRGQYRYPEEYWTNLEVIFLSDASVPFASEVDEG